MSAEEDQYGFARRRTRRARRVSLIAVDTTEGKGDGSGDVVHVVTRYYDDEGNHVATSPEPFGVGGNHQ